MKTIPLTQGKFAIVDNEDFDFLSQWKWAAHHDHNTWYAVRSEKISDGAEYGKRQLIRMHRVILNAPEKTAVDHKNGDGLDNRRSNLRLATQEQNLWNQRRSRRNTSGFKGVSFHKPKKRWRATITANGRQITIGAFKTKEAAYEAYKQAARILHGEFANVG